MLKILTAPQIKALDAVTIKHEPILSIDLMERACLAFINWFSNKFDTTKSVGIVCGTGNNGGDGLGVARILSDRNYRVKVWIVRGSVSESEDFKTNLKRLYGKIEIYEIITDSDKGLFNGCHILIDAIFGSGLSRPVEGIYAQTISCINNTDSIRIAIDIPSGLMGDSHSETTVVQAHYTVAFQLPKLAFLLPENYKYVGDWLIVNIGLNEEGIAAAETDHFLIEKKDIADIKKKRLKFSHKGSYGKGLIVAGSYGKIGAAVLAAKAAMRSGVGLLTTHVPRCGYTILQTACPESMVSVDDHDTLFTKAPILTGYDSIGIGPGIGTDHDTVNAFASILKESKKPIVIDADGINILSDNKELISLIPSGSILTPHPKEFERLVGTWKDDFERLEKLKQFAVKTKNTIVLKGAFTSIASPKGHVYFNPTGNPGMATGGSGDVLTGILTALLAQHYTPLQAAQLGVYLHGMSGDFAAEEKSMEAMIASDLITFLPQAFFEL